MAAVIASHPHSSGAHVRTAGSGRPLLQVIDGGRRAARVYSRGQRPQGSLHPAVYRRRRIGAAVALVALVAVAYLAVTGLGVVLGDPSVPARSAPSSAAAAPAGSPAAASAYVVQPGDTLWSIARRLQPSGDVRSLVDALAARTGSASLQAGQRLSLDGLVD
jgi:nucleoid-associated protein YgaU